MSCSPYIHCSFSDCPVLNLDLSNIMATSGIIASHYGANFTLACITGYYFSVEEFEDLEEVVVTCEIQGVWNIYRTPVCSSGWHPVFGTWH